MQEGGRLSIYLEARDHKAVIKVADNGMGISEDMLEHIFLRRKMCSSISSEMPIPLSATLMTAL